MQHMDAILKAVNAQPYNPLGKIVAFDKDGDFHALENTSNETLITKKISFLVFWVNPERDVNVCWSQKKTHWELEFSTVRDFELIGRISQLLIEDTVKEYSQWYSQHGKAALTVLNS